MVPIGFPGPVRTTALHFDMYTATALFSAIVGVLNVVLLVAVFKEHTVSSDQATEKHLQSSVQEEKQDITDTKLDYWAVIPSICFFFSVLFIFAVFETIATPLAMHMFAWKKAQATLYIGVMLGCAGFLSIFVFVIIKILSKRFNERHLLLGGFILCFCGFMVYLPWGHHLPDIQYAETELPETVINHTAIINNTNELGLQTSVYPWDDTKPILKRTLPFRKMQEYSFAFESETGHTDRFDGVQYKPHDNLTFHTPSNIDHVFNVHSVAESNDITVAPERNSNHSNAEAVGCPFYYDWCMYTPVIFLWQFLLGTFFIAVGYPTCNVMSYAIYSKILGPQPQGIWMGWLTAAGSLARTLGPVFVSQVYDAYGPRVTFVSLAVIIFVTVIAFLGFFKRLVPFKPNRVIVVQDPS